MYDSRNRHGVAKSLLVVCMVLGVLTAGVGAWVLDQPREPGGLGGLGGPQAVIVSGGLSAPTGSGNGSLTVAVKETVGTPAITSITFSNFSLGSTTLPETPQPVLTSGGQPLSEANPLEPGPIACGTVEVQNVTAGDTYDIVVNSTFEGGGGDVQTLSVTAQLGPDGCSTYAATVQQTSSCSAADPLALQQIGPVSYSNFGNSSNEDSIVVSWWNCSSQTLRFVMDASTLNVTIDSSGRTSELTAKLDVSLNYTLVLHGDTGVGLQLPIVFSPPLGPGASILEVNGTLTAVNPTTGTPLSADISFEAS